MTAYEFTYVLVIVILTYRGISNAVIFLRDRRLDFLAYFALAQAAFAFYLFCVLKTINVESAASALIWERIENASLPIMALFFLLFTQHFRPVLPEWGVWVLAGLDALLSIVILFYPYAYTEALSAPREFPGLGITIYETHQPVWVVIFLLSNLLGMSAIIVSYMRMRIFAQRNIRLVLISLILFFLMGASDMAVSLRLYHMPYIAHFGFLLVMFSVEGLFNVKVSYPGNTKPGSDAHTRPIAPGAAAMAGPAAAQSTAILIRVLGPLKIESTHGAAIYKEISKKRKMLKLFKLLILRGNRGVHREEVLEALWADQPSAAAANNLHALVFRLRKLFENQDVLEFAEDRLRLKSDVVTVDAVLLEQLFLKADNAARASDVQTLLRILEEARQLYHGEFFEFDPYFEEAAERRDAIAQKYRKLLGRACELLAAAGKHDLTLPLAEQAVHIENTDEDAWRFLLASLAELGKRGEALKKYEELKRILKRELDVEPDEQTEAIIRKIRASAS